MDRDALESSVRHCYSTWGERYYADYYQADGAYPPIHTGIVRDLLSREKARTVLDAGCGPASMLRDLALPGLDRYGFDLTPEMVREARRVLGGQGVPESHVWEGSVLDPQAFAPVKAFAPVSGMDLALCFGVLPHIPQAADRVVLEHLRDCVRPGGLIAVEARNELFALFTLNRYSRELFRDTLIHEAGLKAAAGDEAERAALDSALAELDQRFRMDLPPLRKGYADEPGYDEVLSRTHNPFEMRAAAEAAGLTEVRTLFYHYHALPPMLEKAVPSLFRRQSVAMEAPEDWRGHFMASAFILVGRRAA
ncbi:class I SAM-dependent methyltransferase [Magnetospirillum sp. 15-1]|uniref:class I SAM-dependent methyltransferase n=1 Tax=Magnetospirillum sp. 15-1 TaxID=1979370 RepID=UPI001483AE73|nr:class I SAM-dependent methyltransferase [Magnetospirillum sp. 15-1]